MNKDLLRFSSAIFPHGLAVLLTLLIFICLGFSFVGCTTIRAEKARDEAWATVAEAEKAKEEAMLAIAAAEKEKEEARATIAEARAARDEAMAAAEEAEKAKEEAALAFTDAEKAQVEATLALTDAVKAKEEATVAIAGAKKTRENAMIAIAKGEKAEDEARTAIAEAEAAKEEAEAVIASADGSALSLSSASKLFIDACKELTEGLMLYQVPKPMTVGEDYRVEMRIGERLEQELAEKLEQDLAADLVGRGAPQIKEIDFCRFLKVELEGEGFDITPLDETEQVVRPGKVAKWSWDVMPEKAGPLKLIFKVSAKIKVAGYDSDETGTYTLSLSTQ